MSPYMINSSIKNNQMSVYLKRTWNQLMLQNTAYLHFRRIIPKQKRTADEILILDIYEVLSRSYCLDVSHLDKCSDLSPDYFPNPPKPIESIGLLAPTVAWSCWALRKQGLQLSWSLRLGENINMNRYVHYWRGYD